MFGKVIQLKKSAAAPGRGGDLPSEITRQFNSEVLEQGLRLAEASRISHINFGRESYFGLVTEPSGKTFNAHVTLHPNILSPYSFIRTIHPQARSRDRKTEDLGK